MTGRPPPFSRWPRITAFLLLLAPLRPVCAQAPPARPTLAATLAGAQPPAKGIALAVDADRVKLPPDALLPGTTPTVAEVSNAYGRTTQRFGLVTAVAPPTMVILNTAPGEPNIYAGMPALDALTLLCAGLTDGQWQALTSEQGLAATDLNTPAQRQLFAALLSHDGKLIVRLQHVTGENWDDNQDLTDRLPQVRLRMGQTVNFELPIKDEPRSFYPNTPIPPALGDPRHYQVVDRADFNGASDTVYGAPVRAEMPNIPKRGQLDFSAAALTASIPLAGLKTVGDLVYRIGNATHTELYVDPRLQDKPLTLSGETSAPAADLLRALAFDLTGTYRQVGPAYVLTDDIIGIGTRRQIWAEFERDADALRSRPVGEASNAIYAHRSARALSWFGDPTAYSSDEGKSKSEYTLYDDTRFLPTLKLPLSRLTPAQQEAAQRIADDWNKQIALHISGNQPLTTNGEITLRPGLSMQLLVPGVDTPIDLNINSDCVDQSFLWQPSREVSDAAMAAFRAQRAKDHPEFAPKPMPPVAPAEVVALLKTVPRRAALVHPRDAKEVDTDIAAAKTLGLNELWLDVFSGGAAHIPGSALSPAKPLPSGGDDILTEAITKTKGTGIRVFPVLSLLFWGPSPPAQDADLNILGETSAQAAARWQQRKATLPNGQEMPEEYTTGGIIPDWPGVAVCPASPDVRLPLFALVRSLAARRGVAGLIWRDAEPPGYRASRMTGSSLSLGYQESLRLGFLRRNHADAVDIISEAGYSKANMDLPNFSTDYFPAAHGNTDLRAEWRQFRDDAGLSFLRALYDTANPSSVRRLPILLKQRGQGQGGTNAEGHHVYPPGWYGSWDDPRRPPPTLHLPGEDDKPGQPSSPPADDTAQAKAQSSTVLVPISSAELDAMRAGLGQPGMRSYLAAHPMPGFVLDLGTATDDNAKPRPDPLIALATSVQAPAAPNRQEQTKP